MLKIGNAPVSWGVDFSDTPANPPWAEVMAGIARAGYRYTELGPYGYYPTDAAQLTTALGHNRLELTAGFLFEPLHDPSAHGRIRDLADKTTALLSTAGGRYLVIIDDISGPREATAGRRDDAAELPTTGRDDMVAFIDELARLAHDRGLLGVLHQHAGTYLEFEDEVDAVLTAIPEERLGVCADTGHLLYAGIDPANFIVKHGPRVKHLHLKDLNPAKHRQALAGGWGFLRAIGEFAFCPLGQGAVDFEKVRHALDRVGFNGHATVEQDRDPTRPADPLEDAKQSLEFVRRNFT